MASAGLVRSAINGLLRKSTTYKAPVVCKLSTVAIQQKHHSIKTAIKLYNNPLCPNGVSRQYSILAGAPRKPPPEEVEQRVFKVCQAYDKLGSVKLTLESHFMNDLGLDSLDHVEVIMAMEDEFGFEIPDSDAERLMRPRDIVQYVCDKEDVYE